MTKIEHIKHLTAPKKQKSIVVGYKHVEGKLTLLHSRKDVITSKIALHALEVLKKYDPKQDLDSQIFVYPTLNDALLRELTDYLVFLSLNKKKQQKYTYPAISDTHLLREATGFMASSLIQYDDLDPISVFLPYSSTEEFSALVEGCHLGSYNFDTYRSKKEKDKKKEREYRVYGDIELSNYGKLLVKAKTVCDAVNYTRDLVNMPNNELTTKVFVNLCKKKSEEIDGLVFNKFNSEFLIKNSLNGIIAVGKGSTNPPYLVKLEYKPINNGEIELALVGKGVMFDSGGLSLKPADYMMTMKEDMAGAATALNVISAVAALKLKINMVAWLPIVENIPSSTATRPGDIVKMYSGKTVEILNTDAEGRLILADAIAMCCKKDKPKHLIDIATLTGAMAVGLGNRVSGLMGDDALVKSANAADEAVWHMPLPGELFESFKSDIADITNLGARYGGGLVAGAFLKEFVDDNIRWSHFDIAGTAFNEKAQYGSTPKMATGVIVRTLVQYATEVEESKTN